MKRLNIFLFFVVVIVPAICMGKAPTSVKAVDLGLSIKWANMNIGATNVYERGYIYAWGEVVCQADMRYWWDSYKWCKRSYSTITKMIPRDKLILTETAISKSAPPLTKYCTDSSYGRVDHKKFLSAEDDTATKNWGKDWRMPTYTEMKELKNKCYWVWTSNYKGKKIEGYIVYKSKNSKDCGKIILKDQKTSNNYSLSDIHIFLPISNSLSNNDPYLMLAPKTGWYWSKSLCESNNSLAYILNFSPAMVDAKAALRCLDCSIRAVHL